MPSSPYCRANSLENRILPYTTRYMNKKPISEDGFLYQLALAVQLQCANSLRHCDKVTSGIKRGPSYTLRWHHIVADRADIDDPHRAFRSSLCSRREEWEEQFGEIKVACKVNRSLRTRS